jgi:hypothetical protein
MTFRFGRYQHGMGCLVVACASAWTFAGDIDFENNPYFGGANESVALFRSVMERAEGSPDRAVRFLYDGDSQETSPGGQGYLYVPSIAYRFWTWFGNIPESQVMAPGNYPGAIMQAAFTAGGVAYGAMPLTRFPFHMAPGGDGQLKNRLVADPWLGFAVVFQANLMGVSGELSEIDRTHSYSERDGLLFHMLLPHVATQGSSLQMRFALAPTSSVSYGATKQATKTVSVPGLAEDANAWSELVTPYDFGGVAPSGDNLMTSYPQVIIAGDPAIPTMQVEVGPVWFSSQNTRGIAISTVSDGGQTTTGQFNLHPDCLPFLQAYAPDVVLLACCVNDAAQGVGVSAEVYKKHVEAKIASYLLANPELVFVLMSDPDTGPTSMEPPNFVQFDLMGDKLRELALVPANRAVFIDRKRLLDMKVGWHREQNASGAFLLDGIHYNLEGARRAAQEDVNAMLTMAFGTVCPSDLNHDTMIDAGDLAILLGAWGTPGRSDLDGDGAVDSADLAMLLGAWGVCAGN